MTMDTFVSAVIGDLVSRSISLVLDRYCSQSQQQGLDESLRRLHGALLRIQATVEEADGRHITNRAMLRQLQAMRDCMYKGHYALDSFRYQTSTIREKAQYEDSSLSAASRFNPARRSRSSARTTEEVQKMIGVLETTVTDMREFLVFLGCYPRVRHQPYCMYILLENCMFGRHEEQERVVSFLLEPELAGAEILPVIGPTWVGKSTLMEHVCQDERVRSNFSWIMLYSVTGMEDGTTLFGDGGVRKHQNLASNGKTLVIIEVAGDVEVEDETWRKMLCSLRVDHICIAPVSKIIITARSEKIADFGTTQALRLHFLPREAQWYFFKTIAFGSEGPEEHPKLAHVCMEVAAEMNGSFIAANFIAGLLRANISVSFWNQTLKLMKYFRNKHSLRFGELALGDRPVNFWIMRKPWAPFYLTSYYKVASAQEDFPRIKLHDVVSGSVAPQGKFNALVWTSSVPPYYSYYVGCVIRKPPQTVVAKRKRSRLMD